MEMNSMNLCIRAYFVLLLLFFNVNHAAKVCCLLHSNIQRSIAFPFACGPFALHASSTNKISLSLRFLALRFHHHQKQHAARRVLQKRRRVVFNCEITTPEMRARRPDILAPKCHPKKTPTQMWPNGTHVI